IMIERVLDSRRITAKIGANRPLRAGARVLVGAHGLVCEQRNGELFTLLLEGGSDVHALLDEHGHVPLPPYIRRPDTNTDRTRYQTLWARHDGAVAAPTAGLHFDADLLQALQERGVEMDYVTLHVGSGTYQRLREGDLRDQRLHAERVHVGRGLCTHVAATKARHKRVIAVGTTVVRSLEAAATTGVLAPFSGETELFIKPGDRFNVIDALITNFHEPQSSLLMLVCAFAGREQVLAAYAHACEQGYRFLSYGDAMFIS
ncbi:MAG TPA: tRNA preQ1(34) S-adenosylmethionine ribosyltransferase-isomerase QueA, partial [Salinisphaeraceae bacterium]|nr:tRNA preQ1(34) S-adenosylmethionine ribosyltransferase-isomerase QueA [Salinisphaeraceae bacterium]